MWRVGDVLSKGVCPQGKPNPANVVCRSFSFMFSSFQLFLLPLGCPSCLALPRHTAWAASQLGLVLFPEPTWLGKEGGQKTWGKDEAAWGLQFIFVKCLFPRSFYSYKDNPPSWTRQHTLELPFTLSKVLAPIGEGRRHLPPYLVRAPRSSPFQRCP